MQTLLLLAVLANPQFEVHSLDGETVRGDVVSVDGEKLVIQPASGEAAKREFAVKELLNAASTTAATMNARPAALIELTDCSLIAAMDFQSSKGTGKILRTAESTIEIPLKAIRSVRFFDPAEKSDKLKSQWNEIASAKAAGDVLVIRKKGAIDSTDGVVGDVTAETVGFTLDGDKIDVKRAKVEGILFAQTASDELPEPIVTVSDQAGSQWRARTLKLEGDQLEITTPAGCKLVIGLASVAKLDFSSGKLVYLSDIEPESFTYQPFFAADQPIASVNEIFRLRRDVGLEKNPLKVDGRVYQKGISLHSRSVVTYRLPGKFRLFKATVGIDDAARDGGGDVALEIAGDGKSLWKGRIRGADLAQALELDVSGVKKLEITADFGEGQDVADHLDLCEAIITK